jgi:hypothetical protein
MIYLIGLVWFATIYFPIALPLGGNLFIPCLPGLLLGMLHATRGVRPQPVLLVVGGAMAFVLFDCLLAESTRTALDRRFLSGMQLPYTLLNCALVAFCRPYSESERRKLAMFVMWAAILITAIGLVEPYTVIGDISDSFRQSFYPEEFLYVDNNRDLNIAGRIRPKAIAAEPSHASWAIMAFSAMLFGLYKDQRSRIIVIVNLLASAVAFSSPSNVAGVITLLGCFLFESGRASIRGLVGAGFLAIVFGTGILFIGSQILGNRYSQGSILEEGSTFVRVIQPFQLAASSLEHDPVFGVGFGGLEEIWQTIEAVEGGEYSLRLNMSIGAAILTIPTFGGIAGVAAFVILLRYLIGLVRPDSRVLFVLIFIFLLLNKASIVNTVAWYVMALWLAARPVHLLRTTSFIRPGRSADSSQEGVRQQIG